MRPNTISRPGLRYVACCAFLKLVECGIDVDLQCQQAIPIGMSEACGSSGGRYTMY
jgi:hypothetical protein